MLKLQLSYSQGKDKLKVDILINVKSIKEILTLLGGVCIKI